MIWIIGGTKDSRDFIEKLISIDEAKKSEIIVSTATDYGEKLLENLEIKTIAKKMDETLMETFIEENNINTIVDISHPYAVEVSKNAISTASKKNILYIRYERKTILEEASNSKHFFDMDKMINYIETLNGNVLVTLGSNNIPFFKNLKNLDKIYFRILSKWDMVKKCEDNGILPKNIIAMQGPFSKELNIAMMRQLNIKYLVSKKSGNTGGELEKKEACDELSVELIYFNKSEIDYPNCYEDANEIINLLIK